jgi:hypothetical protein
MNRDWAASAWPVGNSYPFNLGHFEADSAVTDSTNFLLRSGSAPSGK